MIKYNNKTINDWNIGTSDVVKVYYDDDVCYQKIITGSTPEPQFIELTDIIASSTTATTSDGITVIPTIVGIKKMRLKINKTAYRGSYCWFAFGNGTNTNEVFAINNNSNNECSGLYRITNMQSYATNGTYNWLYWADPDEKTTLEIDVELLNNGNTFCLRQWQQYTNNEALSLLF